MKKLLGFISVITIFALISCSNETSKPADKANQGQKSESQVTSTTSPSIGLINKDGSVSIKMNMKKGDKFEMTMSQSQIITQTIKGQQQTMRQNNSFSYAYLIEEVDAQQNIFTKISYSQIYQEVDAGVGGKQVFDTKTIKKDDKNPQAQILGSLIGKSFTVKQSPYGKVTSVTGIDEIIQNVVASLKPDEKMKLDDQTKKAITAALKEEFGGKKLTDMYEKTLNFYDSIPKKVGDKWNRKYTIQAGFTVNYVTDYTLKAINKDEIELEMVSKIKTDAKPKPSRMGPVSVIYNVSGDQKGSLFIDAISGALKRSEINQKISGEITTVPNEQIKESMKIPILIEAKNSLTTIKK